jgi:hypothetical protein
MSANGSLILIKFGDTGSEKYVLAQTSLTFGLSRDEIVNASKDEDFNTKIAGKLDSTLSFEAFGSLNDDETTKEGLKYLQDSILAKTSEKFTITQVDAEGTQAPIEGSRIIKGVGFFSSVEITAPDNDNTTISATLSISSTPTFEVVPAS